MNSFVVFLPFGKITTAITIIIIIIAITTIRSPENTSINGAHLQCPDAARRRRRVLTVGITIIVLSRRVDDGYTTTSEISVSVIIVMPTIGDVQRELDTHIHAGAFARAPRCPARRPRACHPRVSGLSPGWLLSNYIDLRPPSDWSQHPESASTPLRRRRRRHRASKSHANVKQSDHPGNRKGWCGTAAARGMKRGSVMMPGCCGECCPSFLAAERLIVGGRGGGGFAGGSLSLFLSLLDLA